MKHKSINTEFNDLAIAAIGTLCDELLDPSGRRNLQKLISRDDIGFMPSWEENSDDVDKAFCHYFAHALLKQGENNGLYRDLNEIQGNFISRNGTKWIRGP